MRGLSPKSHFSPLAFLLSCSPRNGEISVEEPGCSSALPHRVAHISNLPCPSQPRKGKAEKPLAVLQNKDCFGYSLFFLIKVIFREICRKVGLLLSRFAIRNLIYF